MVVVFGKKIEEKRFLLETIEEQKKNRYSLKAASFSRFTFTFFHCFNKNCSLKMANPKTRKKEKNESRMSHKFHGKCQKQCKK